MANPRQQGLKRDLSYFRKVVKALMANPRQQGLKPGIGAVHLIDKRALMANPRQQGLKRIGGLSQVSIQWMP